MGVHCPAVHTSGGDDGVVGDDVDDDDDAPKA